MVGLALICLPVFLFDRQTPSVWLIAPVLGAVLVLTVGGAGTTAARVLSWQPIVLVGLISYSAYLWHQPLFAFARIRLPSTRRR